MRKHEMFLSKKLRLAPKIDKLLTLITLAELQPSVVQQVVQNPIPNNPYEASVHQVHILLMSQILCMVLYIECTQGIK
ncbi:hypothetical protein BpHYR1_029349 [Brachionus plicatilis]|uniref:Uncharacterized protein n=1 Tax=Brachionus plicatilis TaxID=10195 RepID=A0A3M7RT98_BRAPC|nr:hypothetical protein BpHYR1_029349 [Brachionus plicatilis]